MGQVSRPITFVCEYDIPSKPNYVRKRFYRRVRRYLRENGLEQVGWSTGSVVFTQDEDFAWYVYREAKKVGGTSHVYRAERLDGEGD